MVKALVMLRLRASRIAYNNNNRKGGRSYLVLIIAIIGV
jgi:hypothetical protein